MVPIILIAISLLLQLNPIIPQEVQTLIINGLVVTGKENQSPFKGHILISKAGKILEVIRETGDELNNLKSKYKDNNIEIIDAENNIIIPGGVDPGVKFDYLEGKHLIETSDNFFTGSIAAVAGGTTTIIDVIEPNINEREKNMNAIKNKLEEAKQNSVIDYTFNMKLNYLDDFKSNRDRIEKNCRKIIHQYGINTFTFDTYTTKYKLSKDQMINALKKKKKYGGLVTINCLNEQLILEEISNYDKSELISEKTKYEAFSEIFSPIQEKTAINEMITLAKEIGFQQGIHINHISTEAALFLIDESKKNGFIATTEITPHHLILTQDLYKSENAIDYITNPPLRTKNDINNLWKGLNNGVIDFIVSDHSPFTKEQKRGKRTKPDFRIYYTDDLNTINKNYDNTYEIWDKNNNPEVIDIPQGLPGIETRLILIYHFGVVEKKISLEKFVQVISTNAAKRFGLYPRKGVLEKWADADIVIIDPNKETILKAENLHQNTDFCPYENMKLKGKIKTVFSRGTKMVDNYKITKECVNHRGNMLRRMRYFLGDN